MTENDRRKFLTRTGAALAGVAGVAALTSASCNRQSEIRNPTREELVKRLKKLAESKPPRNLEPGAMCYSIISPYKEKMPCAECEQEMIDGRMDEILRSYNVPLKRIQDHGVDATLILPEHCPACGFGLEQGKILVEIRYPDHPEPVRVEPEKHSKFRIMIGEATELEMMALFLQGKDRYPAGQGREEALKDRVARLRELFLGVEEKK